MSKVFLEGEWLGEGYLVNKPEIKYKEKSTFKVLRMEPEIVVNYTQFTSNSSNNNPMHSESGYLKVFPNNQSYDWDCELNLSHGFSVNEISNGTLDAMKYKFTVVAETPDSFQRGKSAKGKKVTYLKREYWINEDGHLAYNVWLGVEGAEPYHHLSCVMKKN